MTAPPRPSLADLLARRVVLCDGAVGTVLHAAGATFDRPISELNLRRPDLVRAVHDAYLQAGADVIETNTFDANRHRLSRHGLGDQVAQLNRAGAELAVAARDAGGEALVAGSVTQAGSAGSPEVLSRAQRDEMVAEQVRALVEAGVDMVMLETFGDLGAMAAAVSVVQGVCDLPVVALMTFADDGRSLSGDSVEEIASTLERLGVSVVGTNCTLGPQAIGDVLSDLAAHTRLPLAVLPNAGPPVRVGDHFEYRSDPQYFADAVRRFARLGASMIGGCCGTTPAHVAAAAKVLAGHPAPGRRRPRQPAAPASSAPAEADGVSPGDVESRLAAGRFLMAGQVVPPLGADVERALRDVAVLEDAGAAAVVIGPPTGHRPRMSQVALALLVHERLKAEAILTATTADRSLRSLEADLLGAYAFGLRSVICYTGTPLPRGDYPNTAGIWDVDPIELVALLGRVGRDLEQRPPGTGFFVGARVNPTAEDMRSELERAGRKLEAGARFLVTPPVYDLAALSDLRSHLDRLGRVPLVVTLTPLRDLRHASYLQHEVPGMRVPEPLVARMRGAGDGAAEAGLEIACEAAAAVREMAQGIVASSAAGSAAECAGLLEALGPGEGP